MIPGWQLRSKELEPGARRALRLPRRLLFNFHLANLMPCNYGFPCHRACHREPEDGDRGETAP